MVYLPTLSRRLRILMRASRLSSTPSCSRRARKAGSSSQGPLLPLFRLRPVHFGTVTLSRTLFVWVVVDCSGRAMGSSGRRYSMARLEGLGGFRIYPFQPLFSRRSVCFCRWHSPWQCHHCLSVFAALDLYFGSPQDVQLPRSAVAESYTMVPCGRRHVQQRVRLPSFSAE